MAAGMFFTIQNFSVSFCTHLLFVRSHVMVSAYLACAFKGRVMGVARTVDERDLVEWVFV